MLNSVVQSSSELSDMQSALDAMKADQVKAEKEAVEEVLGSEYAGKTLSELQSNILSAKTKDYDTQNLGKLTSTTRMTIARRLNAYTGSDANITLTAGEVYRHGQREN